MRDRELLGGGGPHLYAMGRGRGRIRAKRDRLGIENSQGVVGTTSHWSGAGAVGQTKPQDRIGVR